jgi:NAD-dependent SIR2 family protein deacetylase
MVGAGISTAAGISDFWSSNGLFHSLKRAHPRALFSSGKELFDINSLRSSTASVPFCQMIGELASQSHSATPTLFHQLLRRLDAIGQLFRVYTQNIDCLEKKCGISFGLPYQIPRVGSRTIRQRGSSSNTWEIPRCVPLHGCLDSVHCPKCSASYSTYPLIDTFLGGDFPICSNCTDVEMLRPFTGKRSRGIGRLRPSITLYNEPHKFGDMIGEAISRDLIHLRARSRVDGRIVLIVAGTSLQIPDVKSMVREFSNCLRFPHNGVPS